MLEEEKRLTVEHEFVLEINSVLTTDLSENVNIPATRQSKTA